ncbi:MAG TPA: hypothetical protein VGH28_10610 [Polyangiaceae bacterium]|jgi:hypothetical protein
MKAWLKLHAKQLATLALWLAAVVALHKWPQFHGDVETLSGALLVVGIQLPPFTLRAGAQAAARIVTGALLLVLALVMVGASVVACTNRQVAKDAYYVEKEGCIQSYSTLAAQRKCLQTVDARWNEAGAPPAATATVDGGVQ